MERPPPAEGDKKSPGAKTDTKVGIPWDLGIHASLLRTDVSETQPGVLHSGITSFGVRGSVTVAIARWLAGGLDVGYTRKGTVLRDLNGLVFDEPRMGYLSLVPRVRFVPLHLGPRLSFHVEFGIPFDITVHSTEDSTPGWDIGGQIGIGARLQINKKLAANADIQYQRGAIDIFPNDGDTMSRHQSLVFSVGLTWAHNRDSDRDGVPDSKDQCWLGQSGSVVASDGCEFKDTDGDGIKDLEDQCPYEPETRNNFEDWDGCPDMLDMDRDGVVDTDENPECLACYPDGYAMDPEGCSYVKKVENNELVLRDPIVFQYRNELLSDAQKKQLDAIAAWLLERPKLVLLVRGHSDTEGEAKGDGGKIATSRRRAEAAATYVEYKRTQKDEKTGTSRLWSLGCSDNLAAVEGYSWKARTLDFWLIDDDFDKPGDYYNSNVKQVKKDAREDAEDAARNAGKDAKDIARAGRKAARDADDELKEEDKRLRYCIPKPPGPAVPNEGPTPATKDTPAKGTPPKDAASPAAPADASSDSQ